MGTGPFQVAPGTTVLITGASSGIGAALAPLFGARRCRVGILARRSDRLADVRQAVLAAGAVECMPIVCDLADRDAGVAAIEACLGQFGHLDVLVNNAAIPKRVPVNELTTRDIDQTMMVNFGSPTAMTLALLPSMLRRNSGVVVNVSSMGGRLGIRHEAAYSASKFALCGWSESLQADLFNTGISVKLIIPGPIDTEIWDQPGNHPAEYDGPFESPSMVANGIIDAIESEQFEHYLPDLKGIVEYKTSNIDAFFQGVANQ